ncbi:hypothetical protein CRG98_039911 [Punica granatum]|uniref:Uncharacterized protein n=1 Tax=Punica granatum TaxID=22663 RepID=A0A2I0I6T6_PUNGR|nr:hypothetical protein CRG98_039911 [Punica granatum]
MERRGNARNFQKSSKKLCAFMRTRISISSGHTCAKPMQRGLGVSTFPGTQTDAREKESPLTVYDP